MSVLTSSSQDLKLGNSADSMPGILLTLCVTCSIVTSSFVHTSNCRFWHGCKTDSVQVVYILVSLSASSGNWYWRKRGCELNRQTTRCISPVSISHSISWCLADFRLYRNWRSLPPYGPMWPEKDYFLLNV